MKKIVFLLFSFTLLLSSISFAKEFPDVASTHWAYNYINELSNQGVIKGYEDGTYRPNGTVTRAEFLKLIVCTNNTRALNAEMMGYFEPSRYDTWYGKYVEQANEVLTFSFNEDLTKPISRIEMGRIIKDFSSRDIYYNEQDYKNSQNTFIDTKNLSKYDNEVINVIKGLGIISGYEDNSFRPNNNMTRAEVSAVISRYMAKIGG